MAFLGAVLQDLLGSWGIFWDSGRSLWDVVGFFGIWEGFCGILRDFEGFFGIWGGVCEISRDSLRCEADLMGLRRDCKDLRRILMDFWGILKDSIRFLGFFRDFLATLGILMGFSVESLGFSLKASGFFDIVSHPWGSEPLWAPGSLTGSLEGNQCWWVQLEQGTAPQWHQDQIKENETKKVISFHLKWIELEWIEMELNRTEQKRQDKRLISNCSSTHQLFLEWNETKQMSRLKWNATTNVR